MTLSPFTPCPCKPLGGSMAPCLPPPDHFGVGWYREGGWIWGCSRAAAAPLALVGLHRRVCPCRIPARAEPLPSGGLLSIFRADSFTLAPGQAGRSLRGLHCTQHAARGVPGYGGRCLQCAKSTKASPGVLGKFSFCPFALLGSLRRPHSAASSRPRRRLRRIGACDASPGVRKAKSKFCPALRVNLRWPWAVTAAPPDPPESPQGNPSPRARKASPVRD